MRHRYNTVCFVVSHGEVRQFFHLIYTLAALAGVFQVETSNPKLAYAARTNTESAIAISNEPNAVTVELEVDEKNWT